MIEKNEIVKIFEEIQKGIIKSKSELEVLEQSSIDFKNESNEASDEVNAVLERVVTRSKEIERTLKLSHNEKVAMVEFICSILKVKKGNPIEFDIQDEHTEQKILIKGKNIYQRPKWRETYENILIEGFHSTLSCKEFETRILEKLNEIKASDEEIKDFKKLCHIMRNREKDSVYNIEIQIDEEFSAMGLLQDISLETDEISTISNTFGENCTAIKFIRIETNFRAMTIYFKDEQKQVNSFNIYFHGGGSWQEYYNKYAPRDFNSNNIHFLAVNLLKDDILKMMEKHYLSLDKVYNTFKNSKDELQHVINSFLVLKQI